MRENKPLSIKQAFELAFDKQAVALNKKNNKNKPTKNKTLNIKTKGSKTEQQRINRILNFVAQTDEGKKSINDAKELGFEFCMSKKNMEFFGTADPDKAYVMLGRQYTDPLLVGTLAHELSHISQYKNKNLPYIEDLNTKSYLMQNRAMEADAEARAVLICWQLKQKGLLKTAYSHYQKRAPHLTKAFEKDIPKEAKELTKEQKNKALSNCFKAWYEKKALVDTYDNFQADDLEGFLFDLEEDGKGYFKKNLTSKKILSNICKTSDEDNYMKKEPNLLQEKEFLKVSELIYKRFENSFNEFAKEEYGVSDNSYKKLIKRKDARKFQEEIDKKISVIKKFDMSKTKDKNDYDKKDSKPVKLMFSKKHMFGR